MIDKGEFERDFACRRLLAPVGAREAQSLIFHHSPKHFCTSLPLFLLHSQPFYRFLQLLTIDLFSATASSSGKSIPLTLVIESLLIGCIGRELLEVIVFFIRDLTTSSHSVGGIGGSGRGPTTFEGKGAVWGIPSSDRSGNCSCP